jgi:fibronectin type 3 domain-containing protein
LTYTPTAAGSQTGSITISSDADNGSLVIPLSGTGSVLSPARVNLAWDASPSSSLVGYHVYRGTASGGPYTRLTGSPTTSLTYSDPTVTAGTTYYYVVTALGSNPPYTGATESAYSNELGVTP